jgi:superfamily II DNA or RNA helicase
MQRVSSSPRRRRAAGRLVWLSEARLRLARARIADVVAGALPAEQLGEIRLRPEQRLAATRALDSIERHGGALLADDVGRGKTFIALAVARRWSRPLVVAPASLRDTWQDAMQRAGVDCALVSHESLSRRRQPPVDPDGIIVDESHRFRSTAAHRHEMLGAIATRAQVLLLSATPLQNRPRDLAAQLAIFLGSRAFSLPTEELARFVVRAPAVVASMPEVAPPEWIRLPIDDGELLGAILVLPAPPRAIDAGDGGILRTLSLVRAWASSRSALTRMIARRMTTAAGIEQCARDGVWPSRRELRAWYAGDDATQLGFAPMLGAASAPPDTREMLLGAAVAERGALEAIRRTIASSPDPDAARVAALRTLRASLAGERILAFSELATTVRAYWTALRSDPGVGMLTSHEARIASGRVTRPELLARFAPRARGAPTPHEREQVTLLLATDLLSEGVNLQDASVVVHLDLPWNPARLAQRVGRVRRLGGAKRVRTYLISPPTSTELLLGVESRLRGKLADAEHAIGRGMPVLPSLVFHDSRASHGADRAVANAEAVGDMYARIAEWRAARHPTVLAEAREATAAGVAPLRGWLAALSSGRLLASLDEASPDDSASVIAAVRLVSGGARRARAGELRDARRALAQRLAAEQVEQDCGLGLGDEVWQLYDRRTALEVGRAPRHQRASALALASTLRSMIARPRSLGADRTLLAHLRELSNPHDTLDWMRRAVTLGGSWRGRTGERDPSHRVVALIVFGPH